MIALLPTCEVHIPDVVYIAAPHAELSSQQISGRLSTPRSVKLYVRRAPPYEPSMLLGCVGSSLPTYVVSVGPSRALTLSRVGSGKTMRPAAPGVRYGSA